MAAPRPCRQCTRPRRADHGADWPTLSRQIRARDGWTCQRCGWQAQGRDRHCLHAHHIQPLGRGGPNTAGNLTSLCLLCHADAPGHGALQAQGAYRTLRAQRPAGSRPTLA